MYKEGFDKFAEGFQEALDKIKSLQEEDNQYIDPAVKEDDTVCEQAYTDVNFEYLDKS